MTPERQKEIIIFESCLCHNSFISSLLRIGAPQQEQLHSERSYIKFIIFSPNQGQSRPATGLGLGPPFWGLMWTHFALFSLKIWEQTKSNCCSFKSDIGDTFASSKKYIWYIWSFLLPIFDIPEKTTLVKSSSKSGQGSGSSLPDQTFIF